MLAVAGEKSVGSEKLGVIRVRYHEEKRLKKYASE
jgi:hypothetical protein